MLPRSASTAPGSADDPQGAVELPAGGAEGDEQRPVRLHGDPRGRERIRGGADVLGRELVDEQRGRARSRDVAREQAPAREDAAGEEQRQVVGGLREPDDRSGLGVVPGPTQHGGQGERFRVARDHGLQRVSGAGPRGRDGQRVAVQGVERGARPLEDGVDDLREVRVLAAQQRLLEDDPVERRGREGHAREQQRTSSASLRGFHETIIVPRHRGCHEKASRKPAAQRRQEPAVHVEDLAGDERRGRRAEEHGRTREVVRLAPAAQRGAADDPRAELGILVQRPGQVGADVAGSDGVHPDAPRRPVDGQGLHQLPDGALGGGVRRVVLPGLLAQERGGEEDGPAIGPGRRWPRAASRRCAHPPRRRCGRGRTAARARRGRARSSRSPRPTSRAGACAPGPARWCRHCSRGCPRRRGRPRSPPIARSTPRRRRRRAGTPARHP